MMRCPEVAPTLMAMLGEGLPDEHLVIRTIGAIAGPEELDQLFARLDKPLLSDSRTEIENVLRNNGRTKELLDKVAAGLDSADPQKRRSLLRILQVSNDPAHAERIRELLKGETDGASRALAIQALGKYGDVDSGKALMALIHGGVQEDRDRAIQAIHSVQNQDTIALLATDYPRLGTDARIAVMGAISRLTGPNEDLLKLAQEDGLRDNELRVRTSSARALGKRGRDQGVDALVSFLERSTHPAERSSAFAALETIHTHKAAHAALGALRVVPNDRQRDQWEQRFRKIAEETKEIRGIEPPG
jgi:HEAT repeat protein